MPLELEPPSYPVGKLSPPSKHHCNCSNATQCCNISISQIGHCFHYISKAHIDMVFFPLSWLVPPGRSLVQRGSEVRRGSELQGLKWLCGDAPQRQVDTRVFDTWESSTQGSGSLQHWFWVGSKRVKLRVKVLKSEQGFGCGRASFAWVEPCQASRGVEHMGGIKVDIRTKGKYSKVSTD